MSKNLIILAILFAALLGAIMFSVFVIPYMPASLSVQGTSGINQTILSNVKKSIIAIETSAHGVRSGLVLNEDGLTVTLDSVLSKKNIISGYVAGDYISLKNLHRTNDGLALLRISKNGMENVKFADEKKLKVGQKVFLITVTSADQDTWKVVDGTISNINDEIITTDIALNSALSSSPLFDENGKLIGIIDTDVNGKMIAMSTSKIKALADIYP